MLFDPGWGATSDAFPPGGHPVANRGLGPSRGLATPGGVWLAGGESNALVLCEGRVLRTAEGAKARLGTGFVARAAEADGLRLLHVLFAPHGTRPLWIGLARLRNEGRSPLRLSYTELWDLPVALEEPEPDAAGSGACVVETPDGERALADAGSVIRARIPDPLPGRGLALEVALLLAPGATRDLAFAYAAPEPGAPTADLVRGFRGNAAAELSRSVKQWRAELAADDLLAAYRGALNP